MDSKSEKTIKTTKTLRFDHDDIKDALITYFNNRYVNDLSEYDFDKLDFNVDAIEYLDGDATGSAGVTLVRVVLVREEEAQN